MEIMSLDGHIYVLTSFLTKHRVKEQSIHNQLSRNRNNLTSYYDHIVDPVDKRTRWIRYSSISPEMFLKYALPAESTLKEYLKSVEEDKLDRLIMLKFEHACSQGFRSCMPYYQGVFYEPELIQQYAVNHSVFLQIQQLRSFSVKLDKIFKHYRKLENMVFQTQSLKVFYKKMKKFERFSYQALVHKSLGTTRNNRKLTINHIEKIKFFYKDKSQYSYTTIHEMLNLWAVSNGFSEVSISTVKQVLADKAIQNECKPSRNGKEWVRKYLSHYRLREEPEFNGELWQMDGSRFQFPYADENNRAAFLVFFVVMDVHSRKIIGYSLGKTENHQLVISALRMAVESTNYLPSEIVRDRGSCFKHENYQRIENDIIALGTSVRMHAPELPNDKGQIERFVSTFQTLFCKGKPGYVGEGIKSKRESGRPAREVLNDSLKLKNLRSRQELVELFKELIEEYNNKSTNTTKKSPFVRFLAGNLSDSAYKLNENEIALMFWERVQEYQVWRSQILLSEGSSRNRQFQYHIYDEQDILRLNGTRVIVCYQKSDRSRVKLFDQNERFICELKYSKPIKMVRPKEIKPSNNKLLNEQFIAQNTSDTLGQIPKEYQLYKQPASLDLILTKTKGNEEY